MGVYRFLVSFRRSLLKMCSRVVSYPMLIYCFASMKHGLSFSLSWWLIKDRCAKDHRKVAEITRPVTIVVQCMYVLW